MAEFRYFLRRFLHFSEEAANGLGVPSQQHQLLLQIAGAKPGVETTVAYLAERLSVRHHSAVELCSRCEAAGLVRRTPAKSNRRAVVLELTPAGSEVLQSLSAAHASELRVLGPQLLRTLRKLTTPSMEGTR